MVLKGRLLQWTILSAALACTGSMIPSRVCAAEIGSSIPNFELPDTAGEIYNLRSFSRKVVAIVFWAYKCPVSLAYIDRIEELRRKYEVRGVGVLAVAAGANETAAEIRANAVNLKISVPVLLDSEGNVAEKLGATHSPSVFIIDGEGILRYKGAVDNNKRPGESGRISYVDDALDSILAGRKVIVPETRPFGCTLRLAKETR